MLLGLIGFAAFFFFLSAPAPAKKRSTGGDMKPRGVCVPTWPSFGRTASTLPPFPAQTTGTSNDASASTPLDAVCVAAPKRDVRPGCCDCVVLHMCLVCCRRIPRHACVRKEYTSVTPQADRRGRMGTRRQLVVRVHWALFTRRPEKPNADWRMRLPLVLSYSPLPQPRFSRLPFRTDDLITPLQKSRVSDVV